MQSTQNTAPLPKLLALAARLRAARYFRGFETDKAFCEQFGITHTTLSHYLSGRRPIPAKRIKEYSEYLDINYEWLAEGNGSMLNHAPTADEQQRLDDALTKYRVMLTKPATNELNTDLLTLILKECAEMQSEHKAKLDPDTMSNIVSDIYSSVSHMNIDKEHWPYAIKGALGVRVAFAKAAE